MNMICLVNSSLRAPQPQSCDYFYFTIIFNLKFDVTSEKFLEFKSLSLDR